MGAAYKLQDLQRLADREIFVDANVLIHLFWSTNNQKWETEYAKMYSSLMKQSNKLYVDFLVVSEVINRMLRIEHQKKQPSLTFKQFRDGVDGQQALSDIYFVVEDQILNQFTVIGKSFSKTDILSFLNVDSLDFLDKGFLKICQDNSFVLFTNDKDFKGANIDVLTCNPAIL